MMRLSIRPLYLLHRWLGIVLCILFAIWFLSGIVMLYVGYPKLTPQERYQSLAEVPVDQVRLTPAEALAQLRAQAPDLGEPSEVRLSATSPQRPLYTFSFLRAPGKPKAGSSRRSAVAIDAISGQLIERIDDAQALVSASAYATGLSIMATPVVEARIQEDAFTHSRALDPHRPLVLVKLQDPDDTWLYVSSRTGEIVRDASGFERNWNRVGAWLHWLYPLRGGVVDRYWADIVNILSIAGTLGAITGIVIGWKRIRLRTRYRSGDRSPYQKPAQKLHHALGLVFGLLVLTWVFSGLMSMNPWGLFDSNSAKPNLQAYHQLPLKLEAKQSTAALPGTGPLSNRVNRQGEAQLAWELKDLQPTDPAVTKEVVWSQIGHRMIVSLRDERGQARIFDHSSKKELTASGEPESAAAQARLRIQDAQRLFPNHSVIRTERLDRYDFWYYARESHTMLGHVEKPLPVLRVVFDDPAATWVHLDLRQGAFLGSIDHNGRIKRVAFALLHSWDWLPLIERRPLWDAVMIVASLGGLLLSLTAVVLGVARLSRPRRHKQGDARRRLFQWPEHAPSLRKARRAHPAE